jgi:hypothetical protein
MIIISWDVGILHLAYCVLEYLPNRDCDIKILDWNIINLIDDERINLVCCGIKRKKQKNDNILKCNRKAVYYLHTIDNVYYGFCKTHLSQYTKYWSQLDTINLFSIIESEHPCEYQKKNGQKCGRNSKYFFKHDLSYFCTMHYKMILRKKIKEFSPQPTKKLAVKNCSTAQLQLNLIKKLDQLSEHFSKLGIEEVIIENQPTYKNPKMKSISNTLFDYFLIRGYVDKIHQMNVKLVRFICPSNKLKIRKNKVKLFRSKSKKYKVTKKLAIQYTEELLAGNMEQIEYLNLYPKKDDLCDAYLQGRYYLEYIKKIIDVDK